MHLQQLRKPLNACQCICNTSEHHRDRRGACFGQVNRCQLRHHLRAAAKLRAQVVAPGGHHYLLALAVHPAARGQGRGRRLLQATLAAMRATAAVPCYLDTQGAEQLPFFQRMGFRLAGQCLAGPEDNASTTWGLLHASFL